MKKVLILIAVVVLGVGGYFGYEKVGSHKFVETLTPHVKNVSLRTTNAIGYETESDKQITFKELFEKLEADIQEIDKRLLEVQSVSTAKTAAVTDPTVSYLKTNQLFLRAMLQQYRKQLEFSSKMKWARKKVDDLKSVDHYGYKYAQTAFKEALSEMNEAEKEYKEAQVELNEAVIKLKTAREPLATVFPGDALIDAKKLEEASKILKKKDDDKKEEAESK